MRKHAGQVAFPGGKRDKEDRGDDVTTALREAREETGMALLPSAVVCELDRLAQTSFTPALVVTPVVAGLTPRDLATLRPNPGEVDAIFLAPLWQFLCRSVRYRYKDARHSDGTLLYRAHHFGCMYRGNTYDVWGMTANVLTHLAELVYRRKPDFDVPSADLTRSATTISAKLREAPSSSPSPRL